MSVQETQSEALLNDETLHELGLTEQPFLEEKNKQRTADAASQKARAVLEQNVRFGDSLHLLVGEEGAGKTVLLQQLLKHCKNNIKPFVAKGSDSFSAAAFLYAVLNDLDKEAQAESIEEFVEALGPILEQVTEDNLSPLLIIDDAHLAPMEEIAELVDILQHFENENGKTARLLLTGPHALQQSIARFDEQFEGLNLNYSTTQLEPLDEARTREYLTNRLNQAGFTNTFPFTDKAISKIQHDSAGLPGNVNNIAAQYLNGVYRGAPVKRERSGWMSSVEWPVLLIGAAAVGAIGIGLSMFFGNEPKNEVISVSESEAIEQPIVETTSVVESSQPETAPETNNPLLLPETIIEDTTTITTVENSTGTTTDLIEETVTTVVTPTDTTVTTEQIIESVQTPADGSPLIAEESGTRVIETFEQPPATIDEATNQLTDRVSETFSSVTAPTATNSDAIAASKSIGSSTIVTDSIPETSTELSDDSLLDTTQASASNALESATLGAANTSAAAAAAITSSDNTDDLLQGETDAAATAPETNDLAENTLTTNPERAIENENWVLFQSPLKFTVQLATSRERDYVIDLAKTMEVGDPVAIYPFRTTNSNNAVFGLLSGLYDTRSDAIAAVERMSDQTKRFGIWIRPVSDLQAAIKRRN